MLSMNNSSLCETVQETFSETDEWDFEIHQNDTQNIILAKKHASNTQHGVLLH